MEYNRPKVGTGVIIIKDNKVLLGKRKNSGEWCFPGGHLEFKENIIDCGIRETLEETGIKIKNIKIVTFTNDNNHHLDIHYITIFMLADHDSGDPKVTEPDKFKDWGWFYWNELPEPLFLSIKNLLASGFNPFE